MAKFRKFYRRVPKSDPFCEELQKYLAVYLEQMPGSSITDLRSMVGMAAKYILPRVAWDYAGPINHLPRLGIDLATHPIAESIFQGFRAIDSTKMDQLNSATAFLKKMARHDHKTEKMSRKVRKKRLTRFRQDVSSILFKLHVLNKLPKKASVGVRYSTECIKKQFLGH